MDSLKNVVPGADSTAQETALWIHEDGHSKAYKHIVDGACECKTCASKIRHIILPFAA
jgi:hypothetical protein